MEIISAITILICGILILNLARISLLAFLNKYDKRIALKECVLYGIFLIGFLLISSIATKISLEGVDGPIIKQKEVIEETEGVI